MLRTRPLLIFAAALVLLLSAGGSANAQITKSPLPQPTGYVNDYAGVIDSASKAQLETTLGNLDRQQQIQFSVVTVDTTGGQDIFDFSLAVARGWGIGSKDTQKPSLLLLVAIKDRKYFTQVSRHLEGDLPDGLVGQIQREFLVPTFRAGLYGQGLAITIDKYIVAVAEKRGFSTDTIFTTGTIRVSEQRPAAKNNSAGALVIVLFAGVIVVILLLVAIRGRGGRGGGGGWGGFLTGMLISSLLNSGRGSGSSGWGGGGFGGGGSSGGGSSGGGFGGFGGGGDFGGGGSGGSW